MKWVHKSSFGVIVCIIAGAALLRISGVSYGLPLRLIADESQYIAAGLLMVQKGVLVPPHDLRDFDKLLYNPPHILYLFLLPFWFLRFVVETNTLASYFIVARLISVGAGLLTIYFVYQAARCLWPDRKNAALFSAYFLATSILAIAGSASSRHWPFAALLAALGFAILVDARRAFFARYLRVAIIAGIGVGVNQVVGALIAVATLWYFFVERGSMRRLVAASWFYASIGIFAALAVIPFLLFPQNFNAVGGELMRNFVPSLGGFLTAPAVFLAPMAKSDPVFILFALIGFAALWRANRRLFWILLAIVSSYTEIFWLVYFFRHRYLAIIAPLFAVVAGFGAAAMWEVASRRRWHSVAFGCILLVPLIVSLRFSYLLFHDDSRAQTRVWFETHIPEGSKVIVWAHLTRLASLRSAIGEKGLIEGDRDIEDKNEYDFPNMPWGRRFHALNLYDIQTESFYDGIVRYACAREYDYAIVQEAGDFQTPRRMALIKRLVRGAEKLRSFGLSDEEYSVTGTQFDGWPWTIFRLPEFGPPISIYRLEKKALCQDEESTARTIFAGDQSLEPNMARVHRFTLDKPYNVRIIISSDRPATPLLFTENAFDAWQAGKPPHAMFRVEGAERIVPLEKGKYVLAIGASEAGAVYSLTLRTDELFFRRDVFFK